MPPQSSAAPEARRRVSRTPGIAVLAGLLVVAADASATPDLTVDEWRTDLRTLVHAIEEIHPDPFGQVSREAFEARVADVDARLGEMSGEEAVTALQGIAASIRDGHTSMMLTSAGGPFARQFPVVIYPFEDGVYLTGADTALAEGVGGRVTRIGSLPVDEAIERVKTVLSGENAFTILDRVPNALTIPGLLFGLGITDDVDRLTLEVEVDGQQRRLVTGPVPAPAFTFAGPELVTDGVRARPADIPVPLHLRQPADHSLVEYRADDKLLYVQLNQVRTPEGESFAAFTERVFAIADANEVETFVLDIRFNHGGNNQLLRPLIHGLIKREDTINRPGHFFTVIGRGTFSAAITCTAWLEQHTNTRFVGEPAGSGPIHFGDAELITLPGSGIRVFVSEWSWQTGLPWDAREWFAPVIAVPPTMADYRAGRDPALAAIREVGSLPPLADRVDAAVRDGGADAARAIVVAHRERFPDRWGVTVEGTLNRLGYELLGSDRVDDAVAVLGIVTELYPSSANAWDSLGEATLATGDRDRAIAHYEKALEVDPDFGNAQRMLAEIRGEAVDHP